MALPLECLLVVSVEQAVVAPQCTCRLADAGARVIKVERPEGDFARAYAQMRAAELMVHEAAHKYEAGADIGPEANMAKLLAADASWFAADMCVQTHGGFGFAEEYDV